SELAGPHGGRAPCVARDGRSARGTGARACPSSHPAVRREVEAPPTSYPRDRPRTNARPVTPCDRCRPAVPPRALPWAGNASPQTRPARRASRKATHMVPTTTSAPASSPLTVHVIHDNPEWIPTFATALETRGIEVVEWLLPDTTIDLSQEPPQGLYWSRLS